MTAEPINEVRFTGEIHPYAARFRLLSDPELDELAESIREDGQEEPIVLDQDGRLLDGRNRLEACSRVGVAPIFTVKRCTEAQAIGLIRKANVKRRHDSAGARAMGDAVALHMLGKRRNGRWVRASTKTFVDGDAASAKAIEKAGFILDWRPDLADPVMNDELAIDAAYQQAKAAEDEAKADERAAELAASLLADLRENRPDLADLVEAKALPLDDALVIRDKERAEETARINGIRERRRKFSEGLSGAIHYLAPLALYPDRREQLTSDLDPEAMLMPIKPADITAARQALDLVAETLGAHE